MHRLGCLPKRYSYQKREFSLDLVQLPKHELAPYCLVNTQDNHKNWKSVLVPNFQFGKKLVLDEHHAAHARSAMPLLFAENPCQIFLWRDVLTKHVGGDNWWSFGWRRTLIPHVCFSVQPCSVAIGLDLQNSPCAAYQCSPGASSSSSVPWNRTEKMSILMGAANPHSEINRCTCMSSPLTWIPENIVLQNLSQIQLSSYTTTFQNW
jgi:hypothetical protein